jgi:hypothetical protein
MKKKWSCSECDYESGRRWNVSRHITKMHYEGSPQLSIRYACKTRSKYDTGNSSDKGYASDLTESFQKERDSKIFAESYEFKDPVYRLAMQFQKAMKLKEGIEKTMIMSDLFKQLDHLTKRPEVGFPNFYLAPRENLGFAPENFTVSRAHSGSPSVRGQTKAMNNNLVGNKRMKEFTAADKKKKYNGAVAFFAGLYLDRVCTNDFLKNLRKI